MEPTSVFDALATSTASRVDTPADKIILRTLVDQLAGIPEGSGLKNIVDALQRHGLRSQADSWIKSVPNVDVSGAELKAALEYDDSPLPEKWVEKTAQACNLQPDEVFEHLAYILPSIIERLSPRGELPSEPVVQATLESIRKQLSSAR